MSRSAILGLVLAALVQGAAQAQSLDISWNREINIGSAAERVLALQRLTGAVPVLTQVTSCYQRTAGFKEFNQQLEGCMAMDMSMSYLSTRAAAGPVSGKQQLPTTGYDDAEKRIRAEFKRIGMASPVEQTRQIEFMALIVRDTLQQALQQKSR